MNMFNKTQCTQCNEWTQNFSQQKMFLSYIAINDCKDDMFKNISAYEQILVFEVKNCSEKVQWKCKIHSYEECVKKDNIFHAWISMRPWQLYQRWWNKKIYASIIKKYITKLYMNIINRIKLTRKSNIQVVNR